MNSSNKQHITLGDEENPLVTNLMEFLATIGGVNHYCLMDRHGKIVFDSSPDPQPHEVSDFIAYSIVSAIKIRQALSTKGPSRVWFALKNDEKLLIIPGAGIIIALFLMANVSIDEMAAEVAAVLTDTCSPHVP